MQVDQTWFGEKDVVTSVSIAPKLPVGLRTTTAIVSSHNKK